MTAVLNQDQAAQIVTKHSFPSFPSGLRTDGMVESPITTTADRSEPSAQQPTEQQLGELLARGEVDTTGMAPDGKVIFNGQIMDRAEAARLHDEAILAGRKSAYFDIQDVIEDYLPLGQARLRLRTNLLWGAAFRVRNALTDVIFSMHSEAREAGNIDKFNDFVADLQAAGNAAAYAEDMGYATYGSGTRKVAALLSIYDQWRDLCIKDAAQLRVKNELPDMYSVIQELPQADDSEREKMIIAVKLMMEGSAQEDIDIAIKGVCDKLTEEHKQKIAQHSSFEPIMTRILSDVAMHTDDKVPFYELPLETQGAIIRSAVNSVSKLPQQLAKMRSVSALDMAMAMPMVRRLNEKLNDVLADPRFAV